VVALLQFCKRRREHDVMRNSDRACSTAYSTSATNAPTYMQSRRRQGHQHRSTLNQLQHIICTASRIRHSIEKLLRTQFTRQTSQSPTTSSHLRLDLSYRSELIRCFCADFKYVSTQSTSPLTACNVPTHCAVTRHWYSWHVPRRLIVSWH